MPRTLVVLLAIFNLILSHELAMTRYIKAEKEAQENQLSESHSRQKRGYGAFFRAGLTGAAWGSYALSVGTTVYHAIRKCKDYRPKPCKTPLCKYVNPCPNVCRNPEDNRAYVDNEKEVIKQRLDLMDQMLLDGYTIDTLGRSAMIDNKRILTEIGKINGHVDALISSIVKLDDGISEKFLKHSTAIQALILDQRATLDDIVSSPAVQGIFDEWTWKGTGAFVLSLASNIGYGVYLKLSERYAITKLYTEMKADFTKKFINQKSIYNRNRFAYVQGYSTGNIDAQLKQRAKAVYQANQAAQKMQTSQRIINNVVTPAINAIYTAFSIWSTYKEIENCQKITDDMQGTAIEVTDKRDSIEEIMETEVKPIVQLVDEKSWQPAKDLWTNETIINWLENIRNLTLEANNTNLDSASSIEYFIQNIGQAEVRTIISLQRTLLVALDNIKFQFECLADKQHAITIVINDCKLGRNPFNVLYNDANSLYKLNREDCLTRKIVPNTTEEELKSIIDKMATEKGWYCNCLLNDNDLLMRVCSEKLKGYNTSAAVLTQVNKTSLTEEMVSNFLARCPQPKITPQNKDYTCLLFCKYQTLQQIAASAGLLESQVNEIIKTCPICIVTNSIKTEICALHFCKSEDAFKIETKVRLPLSTVEHVIKNCVQKCVPDDTQSKEICYSFRCQTFKTSEIANQLSLPLATVDEVTLQCDIILPSCVISNDVKTKIMEVKCYGASPQTISGIFKLQLTLVESVYNSQACEDYKANGLKQ